MNTLLSLNILKKLFESKKELFVHIKSSHDQKFIISPMDKENFQVVEKEVQTRDFEENDQIKYILENYNDLEKKIDKKLDENLNKLNGVFENQAKLIEKKEENMRKSVIELENSHISSSRLKEQEILTQQEKTDRSVKDLESKFQKNSEIFLSFQNLVLNYHQNEAKKLEEINSKLVNFKPNFGNEKNESINDDSNNDLREKMINHLQVIDQKLLESPKKNQRSPLKILPPSKEWAVGELESDEDSKEDVIYPEEINEGHLRFKNPIDVIRTAEKELKIAIDEK